MGSNRTMVAPMATNATRPNSGESIRHTARLFSVNTLAKVELTAIGFTVYSLPRTSVIDSRVPPTGKWNR